MPKGSRPKQQHRSPPREPHGRPGQYFAIWLTDAEGKERYLTDSNHESYGPVLFARMSDAEREAGRQIRPLGHAVRNGGWVKLPDIVRAEVVEIDVGRPMQREHAA